MRHRLLVLALAGILHAGAELAAQPVQPELKVDLWIDPRSFDLGDARVDDLFRQMPFERVILDCFAGGSTLVSTQNAVFPQMEAYAGRDGVVREAVAKLQARKIKVYAAFDCFRWDDEKGPDVFKKNPDLLEVGNLPKDNGRCRDGRYSSPFIPKSREVLKKLAQDLAEKIRNFDGVVFFCNVGSTDGTVGFSLPARQAFFQETGLDLYGAARERQEGESTQVVPRDLKAYMKWMDWRRDKIASVLGEVKEIFKAKLKNPGLALVAYSDYHRQSICDQNETLADGREYMRRVGFDELVVRLRFNNRKSGENFVELRDQTKKNFPAASCSLVMDLSAKEYLRQTMESVAGRTVERAVIRLDDADDLGDFRNFKDRFEDPARLRCILVRQDLRDLELDPRLQTRVNVNEDGESAVPPQIAELQTQLKIPIAIKNASPQAKYAGGVSGYPAWTYMQNLAVSGQGVRGRWEKTKDGYDFVVTWPVADQEKAVPNDEGGEKESAQPPVYSNLLWLALVAIAMACVVAGVITALYARRPVKT